MNQFRPSFCRVFPSVFLLIGKNLVSGRRKIFALGLLTAILSASSAPAQTGEWTWMGGYSTAGPVCYGSGENGFYSFCGRKGVYGTLGESAAGNLPGGRSSQVVWTDSSGNIWLFGGDGFDSSGSSGFLNDLWKYNPTTRQWAWMSGSKTAAKSQLGVYGTKGSPAKSNVPGGRTDAVGWADRKGNIWLFGGFGYDSQGIVGYLNDVWLFNSQTREWTWIGGSSAVGCDDCIQYGVYGTLGVAAPRNTPAGRISATVWVGSDGSFWLFGGSGWDSVGSFGLLNDMWKYTPGTEEWTWMGGSSQIPCNAVECTGEPGVYGTRGTPSVDNIPGSRNSAAGITDPDGNFWLFGGADSYENFNDLWEFNTVTREWTWINGSEETGAVGVYGVLGVAAPTNVPGARSGMVVWADKLGNLWLFGGGSGSIAENDLWRFQTFTQEWTWMGGSSSIPDDCYQINGYPLCGVAGVYGTLGKASSKNSPGSREDGVGWSDSSGNLWLFGGDGDDSSGNWSALDDTWKYQPPAAGAQTAKPVISPAGGVYTTAQSVKLSSATPKAVIHYTTDGTPPTSSSAIYKGAIKVAETETIEAAAELTGELPSVTAAATFTILPYAAEPVISPAKGDFSQAQYVTISDKTKGAVIYFTVDGTTPTTASNVYSIPIAVMTTQTIKAVAVAAGYTNSMIAKATYTVSTPPPAPGDWIWQRGGKTVDQNGVYGTPGVPSGSSLPGSRTAAATWTDANGNLWLFGGEGCNSAESSSCNILLNDLWMFSVKTKDWTWIAGSGTATHCIGVYCGNSGIYGAQGTAAAGNTPGGRYQAVAWTANGNLWLFGGFGYDVSGYYGYLDDLWKFDLSTHQWTWVSGNSALPGYSASFAGVYGTLGVANAANHPGSRIGAVGWTAESGSLWLLGGYGTDSVDDYGGITWVLNDLWEFNTASRKWTWMGGSSTGGFTPAVGVYGTLGVGAAGNFPGGRENAVGWRDAKGNFWLFGGSGYASTDTKGNLNELNDLWEFEFATKMWIWMSGSSTVAANCQEISGTSICGQPGVYGTQGELAQGNVPGSRISAAVWSDSAGNLWLFGGGGFDSTGAAGDLNDLWKFNLASQEWAWMKGSNTVPGNGSGTGGQSGIYGTWGWPAARNLPGGRVQPLSWSDNAGNLWLLGGAGYDATGKQGILNDLWEYEKP